MKAKDFSHFIVCVAVTFFFLGVTSHSCAREPKGVYLITEVKAHVGEYVSVVGRVEQATISTKGTQVLNFGADYPNALFTAVVIDPDGEVMADQPEPLGRRVMVTGTITLDQGTPEIVVRSKDAVDVEEDIPFLFPTEIVLIIAIVWVLGATLVGVVRKHKGSFRTVAGLIAAIALIYIFVGHYDDNRAPYGADSRQLFHETWGDHGYN